MSEEGDHIDTALEQAHSEGFSRLCLFCLKGFNGKKCLNCRAPQSESGEAKEPTREKVCSICHRSIGGALHYRGDHLSCLPREAAAPASSVTEPPPYEVFEYFGEGIVDGNSVRPSPVTEPRCKACENERIYAYSIPLTERASHTCKPAEPSKTTLDEMLTKCEGAAMQKWVSKERCEPPHVIAEAERVYLAARKAIIDRFAEKEHAIQQFRSALENRDEIVGNSFREISRLEAELREAREAQPTKEEAEAVVRFVDGDLHKANYFHAGFAKLRLIANSEEAPK